MNKTITSFIFITAALISSNNCCMFLSLKRFSPAWRSQQGNRVVYINQILSPDKYNRLRKEIKKHKRLLGLLKQGSSINLQVLWELEGKIKKNRKAIQQYTIKKFNDNK